MKKHAYLVVAYNNWEVLNTQFRILDDFRNDIFLIVDSKSTDFDPCLLYKPLNARMTLLPRRCIYWAEFSQVKALLDLIQAAISSETNEVQYSYFHFFSGTDLPIKSQDFIHGFCDSVNKNFIGIVPKVFPYSTNRVKYYWPLLRTKIYKKYKVIKGVSLLSTYIQRLFGVNRLRDSKLDIYNGWDWASITHEFALFLLSNQVEISHMFNKCLCPSELWIHTLCYNSSFRDTLYDEHNLKNGSMRFIDWERGRPYTWGQDEGDFEKLVSSPYLFARKFDSKYIRLVQEIEKYVTQK